MGKKERFELPTVDVVCFDITDIITTSGDGNGGTASGGTTGGEFGSEYNNPWMAEWD